jgi:hypothetical protein
MSVIAVTSFTAAPGKIAEAQALLKDFVAIAKDFGAKGHVASVVSGGIPGSLNVNLEYADPVAYGTALDQSNADKGVQKLRERAQQSQALAPLRASTYTELPGLEVPYADLASRSVIVATLFQVRQGKQAQSLERIKRSKKITEKHGGKMRALQSVTSDPFGLTVSAVYYPNFAEWGKAGTALAADPEWQALGAEIVGENASADFLRSTLMRVI